MSLFQQACATYDAMLPVVTYSGTGVPLPPVAHFVTQADVEITIDASGKFMHAAKRRTKWEKRRHEPDIPPDPKVVIPVTESSLGRTGKGAAVNPHYLCDHLKYLDPENTASYEAFVSQLGGWTAVAKQPKLDAILAYVRSGTIMDDLASAGMTDLDAKTMICWRVNGLGQDSGPCWTDRKLMDSLTEYHMNRLVREGRPVGLCMITGKQTLLALQHAKGLSPKDGNAKLVSCCSGTNNKFTYMGRMLTPEQAMTVGYEASQKAHNALAWLIGNQGVSYGGRVFLCWNPEGLEIPSVTGRMMRKDSAKKSAVSASDYQQQLKDALTGWRSDLPDEAGVVFVAFDSPSKGCLSVVAYNEISTGEYLDRLYAWDSVCCMGNSAPTLEQLVRFSYGTPRNGTYVSPKEKLRSNVMQRLVLARLDGTPFPADVENLLVSHASNLMVCDRKVEEKKKKKAVKPGAEKPRQWKGVSPRDQLLRAACGAIKKYRSDVYKEDWSMRLGENPNDPRTKDRSFVFGQLLAVAEQVESQVLYKRHEERETNAMRLQRTFSQSPLTTWKTLHERLEPYFAALPVKSREHYRKLIGELMEKFQTRDLNDPLNELYLIGYYEQRAAFRTKKADGKNAGDAVGDSGEAQECEEVQEAEEGFDDDACEDVED